MKWLSLLKQKLLRHSDAVFDWANDRRSITIFTVRIMLEHGLYFFVFW